MKTKPVDVITFPDGRMNTRGASLYLGLSEKTLATMRCKGTGPQFIKRGKIFYFKDDLDWWLTAEGKMISTAQASCSIDDGK